MKSDRELGLSVKKHPAEVNGEYWSQHRHTVPLHTCYLEISQNLVAAAAAAAAARKANPRTLQVHVTCFL